MPKPYTKAFAKPKSWEWWEEADEVTLITRPRRFGKTLNMSMLENFFVSYRERGDLFQGLEISADMENYMASLSLKMLSDYLCRYYGKKVIILLDEYGTPMQEAYVNGYWNEMSAFMGSLFNSAFKSNPYL